MPQPVFALSGDYGYIVPIETLVKSLFYHHRDAKVYVINKDIPQEWFASINHRLRPVGGQLINLHLPADALKGEHVSQPHLNEMSYGRILLPNLVDDDRILYLDSDTVVDGDLRDLFTRDLGGAPLAAVPDLLYTNNFNSGVLLMDIQKLRAIPNLVDRLLAAGDDDQLTQGDQSVLNHFFADSYYQLPLKYNWAIGYDFLCSYYPAYDHHYFEKTGQTRGKVIHYTGPVKPWQQFSTSRCRNRWWQYHDLEWGEICTHQPLPLVASEQAVGQALTFTASDRVQGLADLAAALPEWTFNVIATTKLGDHLTRLVPLPNIRLFPAVSRPVQEQLLAAADLYLDLNHGPKNDKLIGDFQRTGRPLAAFAAVASKAKGAGNYHLFADDDLAGLVAFIKDLKQPEENN